jgi:[ribosomal protein S18]-alanine N-acetyltransferase
MRQEDAEAVARWHYPAPFSFYDWETDDLSELLDPKLRADDFVPVDDDDGSLVGYFHYKPPHRPSLEIGLGMHPDWTGRGLGPKLCRGGLDYARRRAYMHRTGGREWEFIEMHRPAPAG